jgi:hypothetical protein
MLSVVAFGGLAITDWPSGALSSFWSDHAMLTNLVSSAIFAVVTVTVIEAWLRQREDRQKELLRRAEEHRLTIVRSAAYNAVARAPIAQRRIMWFLVHGGELRRVPEFEISEEHVRELRTMLARLELPETSEHSVMLEGLARPSFSSRFPVLAQDRQWRQLVHDVLLDVVHNFRVLVARWSALLVTTDESLRALRDLAAQAEELSRIFVEFNGNKPARLYLGDELKERQLLWSRSFANAVALEEALIDAGGERRTTNRRFVTPGRRLLPTDDLRRLEDRDQDRTQRTLRLHNDADSIAH